MRANANIVLMSRRLVRTLRNLISDNMGQDTYTPYADRILEYITGVPYMASRVLGAANPMSEAAKFIRSEATRDFAMVLCGENEAALNGLYSAVVCLYQMDQISHISKKHLTKDDIKAYKIYRKSAKAIIRKLCDDYSTAKSQKALAKSIVADGMEYVNRLNYSTLFDLEDDEDDDDEFDLEDDDEDDGDIDRILRDRRRAVTTGDFDGDDSQLALSADEIGIEPQFGRARRDAVKLPPDIDYDFSGKATLDVIADRLEAILETNQIIINRLYGRELRVDEKAESDEPLVEDIAKPNPAYEQMIKKMGYHRPPVKSQRIDPTMVKLFKTIQNADLGSLSRQDLIQIYNSLGVQLAALSHSMDEPETATFNLTPTEKAAEPEDESGEEDAQPDPTMNLPLLEDEAPAETEVVEETAAAEEPVKEEPEETDTKDENQTYGTTEESTPSELPFPTETVADRFNRERS